MAVPRAGAPPSGWFSASPGSCRRQASRAFQASTASMVRVAASAAAEVGDTVSAAEIELATENNRSAPSWPSRRWSSCRMTGVWSATVGSTETTSGRPGSRIALPVIDRPSPTVATAAPTVRATRTESSPGSVSGWCRVSAWVRARRSASATTVARFSAGPSGATVITTRATERLMTASMTPGTARTARRAPPRRSRRRRVRSVRGPRSSVAIRCRLLRRTAGPPIASTAMPAATRPTVRAPGTAPSARVPVWTAAVPPISAAPLASPATAVATRNGALSHDMA